MASPKKEEHPVVVALVFLFMAFVAAEIYGSHILRTEPDPENYPGWVRVMHEWHLFSRVYPLADRIADKEEDEARAQERRQWQLARMKAERPRREPPVRTPAAEVRTHPLGQVLTRAAEEANLPGVVVLGVDCAEGRGGFCIAWGQGTSKDADVHALMRTPSFREHRGSVAEWAVSAVHWPSEWRGEPAFFALGIHERKNDADLRKAFEARSRVLRVAHESSGQADESPGAEVGEPLAGDVAPTR